MKKQTHLSFRVPSMFSAPLLRNQHATLPLSLPHTSVFISTLIIAIPLFSLEIGNKMAAEVCVGLKFQAVVLASVLFVNHSCEISLDSVNRSLVRGRSLPRGWCHLPWKWLLGSVIPASYSESSTYLIQIIRANSGNITVRLMPVSLERFLCFRTTSVFYVNNQRLLHYFITHLKLKLETRTDKNWLFKK